MQYILSEEEYKKLTGKAAVKEAVDQFMKDLAKSFRRSEYDLRSFVIDEESFKQTNQQLNERLKNI